MVYRFFVQPRAATYPPKETYSCSVGLGMMRMDDNPHRPLGVEGLKLPPVLRSRVDFPLANMPVKHVYHASLMGCIICATPVGVS